VATRPQYKKDPTTSLPANPQTHYDFFPTTLPKGYPPAGDFSIDLRSLKQEFLQLQAQAHPDLHPPELKSKAEALSSRINEAYKTLQDPLRRAQYILSLNGHGDIEANLEGVGMFGSEEGADNELLMVVMEAREAIEEANSEEDLETIREDNQERIEESKTILEAAMDKEDWEAVKAECVKLRYWMNIKQTVAEWEAGKGVPNLQH
jgi:molecular chaperone HscB